MESKNAYTLIRPKHLHNQHLPDLCEKIVNAYKNQLEQSLCNYRKTLVAVSSFTSFLYFVKARSKILNDIVTFIWINPTDTLRYPIIQVKCNVSPTHSTPALFIGGSTIGGYVEQIAIEILKGDETRIWPKGPNRNIDMFPGERAVRDTTNETLEDDSMQFYSAMRLINVKLDMLSPTLDMEKDSEETQIAKLQSIESFKVRSKWIDRIIFSTQVTHKYPAEKVEFLLKLMAASAPMFDTTLAILVTMAEEEQTTEKLIFPNPFLSVLPRPVKWSHETLTAQMRIVLSNPFIPNQIK